MALAKAELHSESGTVIVCMFNPAEITVSKSNTWQAPPESKGGNAPQLRFQGGQSATLTLSLIMDTSTTGEDVTTHTSKLLALLKVDPALPGADQSSNSARPPWVQLRWGQTASFKAVLERLALRYTYFSSAGVPLRAKADITLKQWEDDDQYPLQNPTSHTPRTHRVHRLIPGETLDKLAARYFRDATRWRLIAEANGIVDPLRLPVGQPVVIPELPVRRRG
ncbi:LysM peptidoglycan-binding domain-containing protein [Propionibacteriaceae bacterium Y2011]|uniref:CIS tube protein n=1 Tax=Microlunatus sp. Y2014 TaxID=3418488 RepID=UPI003B4EE914